MVVPLAGHWVAELVAKKVALLVDCLVDATDVW